MHLKSKKRGDNKRLKSKKTTLFIKNINIYIYIYMNTTAFTEQNIEGVYAPGEQVEVNIKGQWTQGRIQDFQDYTIDYPYHDSAMIKHKKVTKKPNQVKVKIDGTYSTGENTNIMPGSEVEFQDTAKKTYWPPGTVVSKNYNVQIDGNLQTFPHTKIRRPPILGQEESASRPRLRNPPRPLTREEVEQQAIVDARRAAWRAKIAVWRARLARQIPEPEVVQPQPRGTGPAHEVHNEFDEFKSNKWDKFMEIINRTTETNTEFRNSEAPLKPLINYVKTSNSYNPVFNVKDPSLTPEERSKMMEMKADMEKKKAKTIKQIGILFTELQKYSGYKDNIDNITNCIQYVCMQPPEFIDAYINTFIVDYCQAYEQGRKESCVKGVYERVYLSFRDTVKTLCLDKIQETGPAPLCKPEYIEIFDCFYENLPQALLNNYLKDWYDVIDYDEFVKLTPDDRLDHFIEFVKNLGFVKNGIFDSERFAKNEASLRRYYINQKIDDDFIIEEDKVTVDSNAKDTFGGRRTNKRRLNSKTRGNNKRLKSKKRLKNKYSRKI